MVSASDSAGAASAQGWRGRCRVGSCSGCSSPLLCAPASSGQVRPLCPCSLRRGQALPVRPLWAGTTSPGLLPTIPSWRLCGQGGEAVVRAGDGSQGWWCRSWSRCGARGAAPVGQGEPGRPALGCRAGLCPPLLLVPFPGSVPVPQPRAHRSCRSLGAEPAPLRGLRRPRRPLPPRLLLPAPHRPGHAPVLLPARPPRPQVLLLTGGCGGPHRGEPLQPPRAWPPPVSGAGRGGRGLRGWQHGPGGGLALGGAWCRAAPGAPGAEPPPPAGTPWPCPSWGSTGSWSSSSWPSTSSTSTAPSAAASAASCPAAAAPPAAPRPPGGSRRPAPQPRPPVLLGGRRRGPGGCCLWGTRGLGGRR